MDRMRRILAFILALVLLISIIPMDMTVQVAATSDEAAEGGQNDQNLDDDNLDDGLDDQDKSLDDQDKSLDDQDKSLDDPDKDLDDQDQGDQNQNAGEEQVGFNLQKGLPESRTKVSAEDSDVDTYLHLSRYTDNGANFGASNYADMRYDYPSLYEAMLGVYSNVRPARAGYWPYIAFQVEAAQAGEYQISAQIGTRAEAKTIGMIVDGAMHVVDVTTTSGILKKSVYLSQGTHVIIFTAHIPRDMVSRPSTTGSNTQYAYMDFYAFEVSEGLSFAEKPSVEVIQQAMSNFSRVEGENISYVIANGNYNTNISKAYTTRYNNPYTVTVKGATGAAIDAAASADEKKVNTTQTFADLQAGGLDKSQTSFVQHTVIAPQAGTYVIRIGAYLEGSGTMPYGTILVNGTAYQAWFSGNWNGYDAVNLPVALQAGENIIQCIGVTADQTATDGWIGYDFVDLPQGLSAKLVAVSAEASNWDTYLYLNGYKDSGTNFGGPNYNDMRWDYPSLYEDMLGIYSDVDTGKAGRWPYIAFQVNAAQAGEYQISVQIETIADAKTTAMIVDGAVHVVDVTTTSGKLTQSVYLSQGAHVIIFTSPMPCDMVSRPTTTGTNKQYAYMNFYAFEVGEGLNFIEKPTEEAIQKSMQNYSRIEAEDVSYAIANGNYTANISKEYTTRYNSPYTVKVKGAAGAAIDGTASADEKKVNTTQTFADIQAGNLNKSTTSYIQYVVIAPQTGTYTLRVGAYLEGSGTMPYGTILVNGTAYQAQFSGNWNGYDVVNLPVELQAGENIIRCIGVTADQTGTDGWIGYDFIEVLQGLSAKLLAVSAEASNCEDYLYLNRYTDNGTLFGASNYADMRYDYPSLYEAMLGVYSDVKPDRAGYWPYIAFQVNAAQAGEYQISAKIGTNANAKTIGMIVDGAMYVVDVTTTSGWLTETVYLSQGAHIIIFTSPIFRDMVGRPSTGGTNVQYPYMDFYAFELDEGLSFLGAPTLDAIKNSMQNYSRIEAEDFSYASANGNYAADISKGYTRRYQNPYTVKVKGAAGAAINGTATVDEKKVNTTQTFADLQAGSLDKSLTSYVQYAVVAPAAGTYTIRVGAYLEGSGTMPYGTILVNGKAYKVQFSGNWNGYDAVNLPVELQAGKNIIRCIGITADQTGTDGWIGYDFVDLPSGITPEGGRKIVSAADSDCESYLYLNRYVDSGSNFGGPNYADMRYDYPSLYEEMLGIYSNANPGRAGYWPYIAFRVTADEAGYYRIATTIETSAAKTVGMIVDGATYAADVSNNEVTKSVYLTAGEHIVVFTAPMPRDMIVASKQDNALYPWMNYVSFKLDAGLSFGTKPTFADIQAAMSNYIRVEAEDPSCVTAEGKYASETTKTHTRRYGTEVVKLKGTSGAVTNSDYVEYKIYADVAGTYVIRIGAYLEGSGTMPYGTILVNGTAYQAQFSGNWNGYDAVNLTVSLNAGENTVRCIGVVGQDSANGWIGYDFMEIPAGLRYYEAGEYTDVSVNKGFTFEKRTTYETDGTISQEPYTISAWVYLPSGYLKRGGVIFGNYVDGDTPCANFEIGENGMPMFYHINDEGKAVNLVFDKVSVCADVWTNITFTISGNNVSCYRNGVLVDTLTAAHNIDMEAVKNQYLLGGDLRPTTYEGSPNVHYFKGRIIDVALFDKALSEEEVLNVYKNAEANEIKPFTRYKLGTAEIEKDVADVKGDNKLFVKIPYFDKTPASGYAYSFAVVGDTQIVAENDATKGENNLSKIYDWIIANKASKNIQYVFGLGDITDNNTEAEWALAQAQMKKLDAAGIAYSVVRGNHDLVGYNDSSKTDFMTQYLGSAAYKSQFATDTAAGKEGGFYDANISNSWRTFKVGNVNYLMLALDFGPTDKVLTWAGDIIAAHPEHNVIITTHAYLYRDGTTLDAGDTAPPSDYASYGAQNNGDQIWEKLVSKYENIVLVMSGHDPSDNIIVSRDKGDNGNIVTSMLIDPQGVDSDDGSTGMLAMLYFSEDGTSVQVEYLSTVRAAENKPAYFKTVNQFSLELSNEEVSASDKNWADYLYLNQYEDTGSAFGKGYYADMYYDYPSLYADMLGIYSDAKPARANYWPYIAFTVNAPATGEYQITAEIGTKNTAKTIGMIVDGAMYVVDVTTKNGDLTESVYLTEGEHVIIFTSPMPRDMVGAPGQNNASYPYMDFKTFKLSKGLSFGEKPEFADIKAAMTGYTRIEAEDVVYATYNANYGTYATKKYATRYDSEMTAIMGATGAVIDGNVSAEEKKANTSQSFTQLSQGLDAELTSYVEYSINAEEAGKYVIRVGAYVEGSGTMPYGTILVNGKAYKVQFTGNWNGYDAVNLLVELQKGANTIQCIGVTADQENSNAWIGYDYLDIQSGLTANGTGATLVNAGDETYVTFNKYKDNGDTLGGSSHDDMRWDRMSIDILNYAYLDRMPYAAVKVTAATDGEYDIYLKSTWNPNATSNQIGILVDGVTWYPMTLDEFRSHASIWLAPGTHTLVFTTPMPADMQTAAGTAKFDKQAYPWMDMKAIILGKGLTLETAPYKARLEDPYVTFEAEEYAMPNMSSITETGIGSGVYMKAQTAAQIVKNGIDPTVTPYVEYRIEATEAGNYTLYVAMKIGVSAAMYAVPMRSSIVIENGDTRQVKSVYAHKDTSGVVRVIPVTLKLEEGINVVRMTHFTGDSIWDKGYAWNDFDYIEISPAAAKKLTFLPTTVLEAEDANYMSYTEKMADGYSGEAYLGSADYGYIDQNRITFEALDVDNLGDLPRVTYLFEAEKAGTYTISVKFKTGLINYKLDDLDKIGFAVIVNGKDKQLVEFSLGTLDAAVSRLITVDLVEGENEITFTSTLADYMNAVSPRIESEYRLVWVDHDALHLSYGLTSGREAERFGVEDSSVGRGQLKLLGLADGADNAGDADAADDASGSTANYMPGIIIGAAVLAMLLIFIIILMKKKKKEENA